MLKKVHVLGLWSIVAVAFLFCFLHNELKAQGTSIPKEERQALVDLYNNCNGANWRPSSQQWDLNADPTTWKGVKIENGHVTELKLIGIRMEGAIPASFGNLKELENLYCSSNQITKLPDELFTLPKLKGLYVDTQTKNAGQEFTLKMEFPKKINLPSLEVFYLSDNKITGNLPQDINMPKVKILAVHNNKLTGVIPEALTKFPFLEVLALSGNDFVGEIPQDWSRCTSLKQILLDKNKQLGGTFPVSLTKLPNILSISFQWTSIGGEIPASIGNLTKMTDLLLTDSKISGTIPETIGDCASLTQLALGECRLQAPLPETLTKLKKLVLFQLTGNNIGGDIPAWLGKITTIRDLRLAKCGFTGEIPSTLFPMDKTSSEGLKDLKNLDLSFNSLVGHLPEAIKNCGSLVRLWLSSNKLSGNPCSYFTYENFPKLVQIELADNMFEGSIGGLLTNPERMLIKVNIANNNFSGPLLPNVSTSAYGSLTGFAQGSVLVEGNRFTFVDFSNFGEELQPQGQAYYQINYAPQKSTTENRTVVVKMGESFVLDATLANPVWKGETPKELPNTYQWYKNGNAIASETKAKLEVSSFEATDAATYYCEIKNVIAPKLTLKTRDFVVVHDTATEKIAERAFTIERVGDSILVNGATEIALYSIDGSCVAKAMGDTLFIGGLEEVCYVVVAVVDNVRNTVKCFLR